MHQGFVAVVINLDEIVENLVMMDESHAVTDVDK